MGAIKGRNLLRPYEKWIAAPSQSVGRNRHLGLYGRHGRADGRVDRGAPVLILRQVATHRGEIQIAQLAPMGPAPPWPTGRRSTSPTSVISAPVPHRNISSA